MVTLGWNCGLVMIDGSFSGVMEKLRVSMVNFFERRGELSIFNSLSAVSKRKLSPDGFLTQSFVRISAS